MTVFDIARVLDQMNALDDPRALEAFRRELLRTWRGHLPAHLIADTIERKIVERRQLN